jgi:hypothetical protein
MSKFSVLACGLLLSFSSANFALQAPGVAPAAASCIGDPESRNRVEQYLRWHDDAVHSPQVDELEVESYAAAATARSEERP